MDTNRFFQNAAPVTLDEMLEAREQRVHMQKKLLKRFSQPLISFTLNIPGAYKLFPLAEQAFSEGCCAINRQLERAGIAALCRQEQRNITGCELFISVASDADRIKVLMVAIEEGHPLGRLFDIDVLDRDGAILHGESYGRKQRSCLICGGSVWACARNRTHTSEELALKAAACINSYFQRQYADKISEYALKSLLYEVAVTPKPGLVDRVNNGAHHDMDFFLFIDSACSLTPYFRECTLKGLDFGGEPTALFQGLRYPGMCAENTMFAATGHVNTHKGLIFSLGIICAAMGYLSKDGACADLAMLVSLCKQMTGNVLGELEDSKANTHGVEIFRKYGLTGARGEAAQGFPHARKYGLPIISEMMHSGYSANEAGITALLHLIAHVQDTNIIHRSDDHTQAEISRVLRLFLEDSVTPKQIFEKAQALDADFISQNISPGGCADILAVSFMLFFCFPNSDPPKDQSTLTNHR